MPTVAPTSPTRTIKPLPALLVNQIAAGEVVERPASVVKELVDNALDSGGGAITIELEQGGIELVRVTDDGCGIPSEQLPLAVAPHATSKISAAEDLERIGTMGFRGEALASIMSVSRLSLRSRPTGSDAASVIEAEGDVVKPVAPAAGPVGTSVTVRNLFFNTPARRKFLRTPATEQGRCADVVRDAAMAHCACAFKLLADGRALLDAPPNQSPRERIVAVLGKELADQLIEVSGEVEGYVPWRPVPDQPAPAASPMTIWGLVGLPGIARATAQSQHVFINGRPIRDKTIMHAIKEAYRGLIEPGRHPTVALLLEMDPGAVDVNVHPTKSEVRFRDSSRVHSLVLRSIQESLRRADLTPGIGMSGGFAGGYADARAILPETKPGSGGSVTPGQFADYFKRVVPGQAGGQLSYDALRQAVGDGAPVGEVSTAAMNLPTPLPTLSRSGYEPTMPLPVPARPIIQVHNSYLVTQDDQGMIVIDQHALHERVMFEKLLDRVGTGALESQRLLTPVSLGVSPSQMDALEPLAPLLKRLGIEAEPSGPASITIHAFATFLFDRGVDAAEFLSELLERAADEDWATRGFASGSAEPPAAAGGEPRSHINPPAPAGGSAGTLALGQEAVMHEVLDMMACKAAVKAGDHLSEPELAELLAMRERIERSSNCPHGRPTSIRLTIKELEKRFGRS